MQADIGLLPSTRSDDASQGRVGDMVQAIERRVAAHVTSQRLPPPSAKEVLQPQPRTPPLPLTLTLTLTQPLTLTMTQTLTLTLPLTWTQEAAMPTHDVRNFKHEQSRVKWKTCWH